MLHSSMENLDDIVHGHRFFASKAFNGTNGNGNASMPPKTPYLLNHNARGLKNRNETEEQITIKTHSDVMKQIVASVAKLKHKIPRVVFNYLNRRSDKGKANARNGLRPGSARKNSKEKISSMFHHFFNNSKKPKMGSESERHETDDHRSSEEGIDPKSSQEVDVEISNGCGWEESHRLNGLSIGSHDASDSFEELSLTDAVIKDESQKGDSHGTIDKGQMLSQDRMALKPFKKLKLSPFHLLKTKSFRKKNSNVDNGSSSGGSESRYGGSKEGWQKTVLQTRSFKTKGFSVHERKVTKARSHKKEGELCNKPIMMGKRCQLLDLSSPSRKGCEDGRRPIFVWEATLSTIDDDYVERKKPTDFSDEDPRY